MASREEIEAQIASDPYDDDAYSILADVLQLAGDPRGELIAIDLAASRAKLSEQSGWRQRRAELLERHPELAPPPIPGIELGWHLGFVRRVTVTAPYDTRALLAQPALAFATELVLPDDRGGEPARIAEILARMPHLRMLALGEPDGVHYYSRDDGLVELDRCGDLPRLERLFSSVPVRIGSAPSLRSLEIHGGDPDSLRILRDASLPVLDRLSIHLRSPRLTLPWGRPAAFEPIPIAAIEDFTALFAMPLPKLTELALIDCSCGDALVRELAGSPLLRQLTTLRLWNAGITSAGASYVTRERFGHLALLDLTDPGLDDATIAILDGACTEVRTRSTRIDALIRR